MQLTDFENSAYVVFVVLLTRVILSYKLDFLIPLSKVMTGVITAMNTDSADVFNYCIHWPVPTYLYIVFLPVRINHLYFDSGFPISLKMFKDDGWRWSHELVPSP